MFEVIIEHFACAVSRPKLRPAPHIITHPRVARERGARFLGLLVSVRRIKLEHLIGHIAELVFHFLDEGVFAAGVVSREQPAFMRVVAKDHRHVDLLACLFDLQGIAGDDIAVDNRLCDGARIIAGRFLSSNQLICRQRAQVRN